MHENVWGSGDIVPCKMEVRGQFHAPITLHPQKELPVPTGKEARRAPELVCISKIIQNHLLVSSYV